jgi:sulfite reductase alpha subunit-like flavoprotein
MRKNIPTFEEFLIESEMNELKFTSYGVKGLLDAVYRNWDKLKKDIEREMGLRTFKDVLYFIQDGMQEEQYELESWVKSKGIRVEHK